MSQFSNINAGIPAGPSYSDNLHLKVFSGEVMVAYLRETVMKSRIRCRNISSGSSAQFPAIGRGKAGYHTPGDLILGQNVDHDERIIPINDLLVTSRFIANWEEAVNHYDVRSEYTRLMGDELAQEYDRHLFALASGTARAEATGPVSGFGAATIDKIGATPTLAQVVDAIYDGAASFDKKNLPKSGRAVFVTPDVYWDLIQDGSFLNRDFGNDNGSQSGGSIMRVAGFEVVPTNNFALDFTDDANMVKVRRNGAVDTSFNIDNTSAVALMTHSSALGCVHLMGVATEAKYMVERQGTLAVSRMACGYGVLREEGLHLIAAEA